MSLLQATTDSCVGFLSISSLNWVRPKVQRPATTPFVSSIVGQRSKNYSIIFLFQTPPTSSMPISRFIISRPMTKYGRSQNSTLRPFSAIGRLSFTWILKFDNLKCGASRCAGGDAVSILTTRSCTSCVSL